MKKFNLFSVSPCFLLFLIITGTFSCKKNSDGNTAPIPFQGPQNPSFETNAYWVNEYPAGEGFFTYATGTGFLPSQGSYYASLTNWGESGAARVNSVYFYQDGVDFSHSTTMTFDYTFTATAEADVDNSPITSEPETAEILFTSNGTVTLWQTTIYTKVVYSAITSTQVSNNTVTLPSLPAAGRLTIEIITTGNQVVFGIDNIRVH